MAQRPSPSPLDLAHSQAAAHFDAISSVEDLQKATRAELDSLVSKGDAVSLEDVLKGMASLVGAGADPKALMAMMQGNPSAQPPVSPMPEGGAGLAEWLRNQDQLVASHETQMAPAKEAARHVMGVTALHALVGDHLATKGAPGATTSAPVSASPNSLTS